jgi:medium-chain acyl-[acyl-carrier-protein] hydrolase
MNEMDNPMTLRPAVGNRDQRAADQGGMPPRKSSSAGWIVRPAQNPRARLRLFCFPYAGGGASVFHLWRNLLPPEVEVCAIQPPGREMRLAEPPITEWPVLIRQLEAAIQPWADLPFAFFGHSLGAFVAFELTRALRRGGEPGPVHLFVSGRAAPHLPIDRRPIHALPDAEFIEEVRKLNGTPEEVLRSEELMALLTPLLRADFLLFESYRYVEEPALSVPLSAYGGEKDEDSPPHRVAPWRQHTRGAFRQATFHGGHFFIHENRPELLAELGRELHRMVEALPSLRG